MKAKRLTFDTFGDPREVVKVEEFDLPELYADQILVKINASPINPADINFIQGTYGVQPELPSTPGVEGSGIVIKSESSSIPRHHKVIFIKRVGTWASHVICNSGDVVVIPDHIHLNQAAMLKVNPMTAWMLLKNYRELSQGESIIQNAANSGVGQCVIQLAKQLKIPTFNIVRSEERIEQIQAIGSEASFLDTPDLKNNLLSKIEQDNLPKLAFNAVGGDSALRLMDCIAEEGEHITYGAMSLRSLKVPNKFLIFKRISLHGLWVTKELAKMNYQEISEHYTYLANFITEGKLVQPIDSTYTIDDFSEAFEHHFQPYKKGKILLTFDT